MATREPAWFRPEPFSQEVLRYSFRKLGAITTATAQSLNHRSMGFRMAVFAVGGAVFTLQRIIRKKLRPLFIESIYLMTGGVRLHGQEEIVEFVKQCYVKGDIFNSILSLFAIIGEIILFFMEYGLPIPNELYYHPWCSIYEYKLKNELLSKGGFEELLKQAEIRYIESDLSTDTLTDFWNRNPIKHAEAPTIFNWTGDLPLFLVSRFEAVPGSTDLAMSILRELYRGEEMVPLPN